MPDSDDRDAMSASLVPWDSLSPEEQGVLHNLWHQDISRQMHEFSRRLDENTSTTDQIKKDTATLIELVVAGRKVSAVGRWLGRAFAWTYKFVLKFVLPLVVAGAAVMAVIKGAGKP